MKGKERRLSKKSKEFVPNLQEPKPQQNSQLHVVPQLNKNYKQYPR